jgi:hypothetical protein
MLKSSIPIVIAVTIILMLTGMTIVGTSAVLMNYVAVRIISYFYPDDNELSEKCKQLNNDKTSLFLTGSLMYLLNLIVLRLIRYFFGPLCNSYTLGLF